ncbi:MAG: GldG family protein [Planctomycetaceae bacterium]|nr:GldG family protein [Planctomycetaceae bacterium]
MNARLSSFLSRTEFWVVALGLAAFLVLHWILRGAPLGQSAEEEADEAPAPGYRDRVVAAVVLGLLLVLAGAYVAVTRSVPWSLPPFALGFGIVMTLIAINQRHRHASPVLRRTVELSHAALTATLVAGVLIVINVLAFRHGGRPLDLTRERSFTLESLSLNQVRSLDRPVTFTILFGGGPLAGAERARVAELLELYRAANPRMIRVESINPFTELEKTEALARRVPDIPIPPDGGILIDYGEGETVQHALVRNRDLFAMPRPNGASTDFNSTFRGEDAVTAALIGLREEKKPKVAFSTGHGEPSVNDQDYRRPGIATWKTRLGAIGAEVVELSLLSQDVPGDTALLVIVAPKTPFKPDEIARLRSFSDRGGPILALVGSAERSGLGDFLRSYDVEIGGGSLVDPLLNYQGSPKLVFVPIRGPLHHPIIDSLVARAVLVPNAAPLQILSGGSGTPTKPSLVATPILRSGSDSWAETERNVERTVGKDQPGPLTIGVAVADRPKPGEVKEGTPRLVLVSSDSMADNVLLQIEPTNLDFLMNAVGWLRSRPEQSGIRPKEHQALMLAADPILRFRLIMVPTVFAILLILGLGATTYAARRE